MKLLFVQLPLIDYGYNYILGNVPYAPAALASFVDHISGGRAATELLPCDIANFASDDVIVNYVCRAHPDIVCFTSYLWNVERNCDIAGEIRRRCPEIMVFAGGPEIHPDSWVFSGRRDGIDIFVSGEGEWFFERFLANENMDRYAVEINGNRLVTQPQEEIVDPLKIIEPFTAGFLPPMFDGSIFMEMTRGCPYRCAYCYYSKNCATVRELPFENLLRALDMRHECNLAEIYILSPTFNKSPDIMNKLEHIKRHNHGVKLHTEMRADGIGEGMAELLYDAGFRSLEVGLQTLTPEALERIGRRGNGQGELAGMRALKDAGIDIKIGVIPGLPGDTPEMFLRTIETLVTMGFAENVELYPLLMLPGTRIREYGDRDGVYYQKMPPYYFLNGWNFGKHSMRTIGLETENSTGYTSVIRKSPDFVMDDSGTLTRGIVFRGDDVARWDGRLYADDVETSVFTFYVKEPDIDSLHRGLNMLFGALPLKNELYNVVFFTDTRIRESAIEECLRVFDCETLQRRMHVFDEWKEGNGIAFYQVFEDVEAFVAVNSTCVLIDAILRVTRENYKRVLMMPDTAPWPLLVADGMLPSVGEFLRGVYLDCPEMVSFENENEQAMFYTSIEYEYDAAPLSFRVRRMN